MDNFFNKKILFSVFFLLLLSTTVCLLYWLYLSNVSTSVPEKPSSLTSQSSVMGDPLAQPNKKIVLDNDSDESDKNLAQLPDSQRQEYKQLQDEQSAYISLKDKSDDYFKEFEEIENDIRDKDIKADAVIEKLNNQ